MPKISTDKKVLDQCSQYIIDQRCITVISGLSSEDFDVLKKILHFDPTKNPTFRCFEKNPTVGLHVGFSTPGFYSDLIEKRSNLYF